jgi:ABC-type multidrug transport system fused ATPase/permease subunit
MFVASLFETLNLAVLYPLMNYGLKQETQGIILQQFYTVIKLFGKDNLFLSTCVLLIIITVLAVFFRYLNNLFQYRLLASINTAIQNKVLDKYLNADYIFFCEKSTRQTGACCHNSACQCWEYDFIYSEGN